MAQRPDGRCCAARPAGSASRGRVAPRCPPGWSSHSEVPAPLADYLARVARDSEARWRGSSGKTHRGEWAKARCRVAGSTRVDGPQLRVLAGVWRSFSRLMGSIRTTRRSTELPHALIDACGWRMPGSRDCGRSRFDLLIEKRRFHVKHQVVRPAGVRPVLLAKGGLARHRPACFDEVRPAQRHVCHGLVTLVRSCSAATRFVHRRAAARRATAAMSTTSRSRQIGRRATE